MILNNLSKEAIVFGAGKAGTSLVYLLKNEGVNVIACFDNNISRVGERLWGDVEICLPYYINDNIPIFISFYEQRIIKDVESQCREMGYKNIIVVSWEELHSFLNEFDDREFLEVIYKEITGRYLDVNNPKTFTEKIQWLKLNNRNPEYTTFVDKYEVKKYVSERIGSQHIIPTLGIYERFDDIPFDDLPSRFVIKCTHDSGSVVICHNKSDFDYKKAKEIIENHLSVNYYKLGREWPYKAVKPRIIVEKYIDNDGIKGVYDYKIHCFSGIPKYIQVIGNRDFETHTGRQFFFTFEWKKAEWAFDDYPLYEKMIPRPGNLSEMFNIAKKLSSGFSYVRVDLYDISDQIYFGELTFYPGGGWYKYDKLFNYKDDLMLGALIRL